MGETLIVAVFVGLIVKYSGRVIDHLFQIIIKQIKKFTGRK